MTLLNRDRTAPRGPRRSRRTLLAAGVGVVVILAVVLLVSLRTRPSPPSPPSSPLPLRAAGEIALPGGSSRFDYASLDAGRGLLFVAHLGASQVVEIDIRAHRVVRVVQNLSEVHGVLVVPALHRVYATVTGDNRVVTLNEDTGAMLSSAPTGEYPDGLAYDPRRGTVWTTNETGRSETVLDATTGTVRGTVTLGSDVGNVAYDPTSDRMLVDAQSRNQLAVIDPTTLAITAHISLPGCDHDHGLAIDPGNRLAFVACDGNATLITVDLATEHALGTNPVGAGPDVLAYDNTAHRLYVATESGTLTVLDLHGRQISVVGSDFLAGGAHVVAIDPGTHHSFYPVPAASNGQPALLERAPSH